MFALRRVARPVGIAGLLVAIAASLPAQAPAAAPVQPRAPQSPVPQAPTGPVALRALARGIVLQVGDVGGDAVETVLGFETQRIIAAGEALRAPGIAPAAIVRSGDSVSVRAELAGVSASRRGIALGTARLGQPVRVRFGQHSLSGIATAPGVVRMP